MRRREGAGGGGAGVARPVCRSGQTNGAVTEAVRLFTLSLCFSVFFFSPHFSFQYCNSSAPWPRGEGGLARRIREWRGLVALPFLAHQLLAESAEEARPEAKSSRGLDALSLPGSSERRVRISLAAKEQGSQVRLEERVRRNLESFKPPQRKRASPYTPTSKWRFGDS